MIQIGLKVYSTNVEKKSLIIDLYKDNFFNYIELYSVPESFDTTIGTWKSLFIPFIIHAAHDSNGMNLAKRKYKNKNRLLYNEAKQFADTLSSNFIIFHGGFAGNINETIQQLNKFRDNRICIENMPFVNLYGKSCIGCSYDDIKKIIRETSSKLCFDISHFIKYCYAHDIELIPELTKFLQFNPPVVHINDGTMNSCFDTHLHFNEGDYPLKEILLQIKLKLKNFYLSVETQKSDNKWMKDIKNDFTYIKKLIEECYE